MELLAVIAIVSVLFTVMLPGFKKMVKGIMIESYLVDGAQKAGGNVYGQSITDPCLGWEKTEALIYEIAQTLQK
jgi:3-deoxy-7-phosphoheptulonate synthase